MASIIEFAPSGFLGFLEIAFEPGPAIGNATSLIVAALHVASEFNSARPIGVTDIAEQECAKSHKQCPPFKSGYTADRTRAREEVAVSHRFDQIRSVVAASEYHAVC